ncbi:hypothetical protein BO86DRAFT_200260 [Aspergillus japonicus CBS 114.51]|uniref:Uncharacterized protein n=2 Tax=Aspergillus TaxID=5052 RepID=A0A2V5H5R2_ASPV1|nr:hypothetical protein BO86DRAFT_200260 [Aspergillus japonicus CBS 114.51]PYI16183.1 hypothetical protein BO99DRAFT_231407 [Aspergillus violaceofuscus CBS 115571]RAH77983.1 hypothetical protein BO86DRAFT_200260 [Aspergillus japonicus CBS 114.51]
MPRRFHCRVWPISLSSCLSLLVFTIDFNDFHLLPLSFLLSCRLYTLCLAITFSLPHLLVYLPAWHTFRRLSKRHLTYKVTVCYPRPQTTFPSCPSCFAASLRPRLTCWTGSYLSASYIATILEAPGVPRAFAPRTEAFWLL